MKEESFPRLTVQGTMHVTVQEFAVIYLGTSPQTASFVAFGEAESEVIPSLSSKLLTFSFFNFQISLPVVYRVRSQRMFTFYGPGMALNNFHVLTHSIITGLIVYIILTSLLWTLSHK